MARAIGILTLVLAAGACGGSRSSEVFVGSASSFAQVLEATQDSYGQYELKVLVGGSQLLVTQVLEGAPMDVIVTADWPAMEALVAADKVAAPPTLLGHNALVIAVERGNPLAIGSVRDLARPDVKLVLAAAEVPLGRYSAQVLDAAGVETRPVSLAGSATAVAGLLASGEADAGIVYETDAEVWGLTGIPLPPEIDVIAEYYVAPITGAPNPEGGTALIEFLLSSNGRALLARLGFAV